RGLYTLLKPSKLCSMIVNKLTNILTLDFLLSYYLTKSELNLN
ncbi:hypothetical protein ACN38_g10855, partial [Penicillium nordicum]